MTDEVSAGDKETKEMLVGVNELSLFAVQRFKDGVQYDDFTAFYAALLTDKDFKAKMEAAYDNYKAIPDEVKNMGMVGYVDLAKTQLDYLPKFMAVLKKEG